MSKAVTNLEALSVNARIHADGVTVSYDDHDAGKRREFTATTREQAQILVGLVRMAEVAISPNMGESADAASARRSHDVSEPVSVKMRSRRLARARRKDS